MDSTTPNALSMILAVLKDAGVSRFKCADFEVEFPPELAPPKEVLVRAQSSTPEPAPANGYAAIFGGPPPKFKPAVAE